MATKKINPELLSDPRFDSDGMALANDIQNENSFEEYYPNAGDDDFDAVLKLKAKYDITTGVLISTDFLAKLSSPVLSQLKEALRYNKNNPDNPIPIADMIDKGLNATQMQIIISAYMNKIDTEYIQKFIDKSIPYASMNYALQAKLDGFDVYEYIYQGYHPDQIYEICCGLKQNLDVSVYDNIKYSSEVMSLFRRSLEIGVGFPTSELYYLDSGKYVLD